MFFVSNTLCCLLHSKRGKRDEKKKKYCGDYFDNFFNPFLSGPVRSSFPNGWMWLRPVAPRSWPPTIRTGTTPGAHPSPDTSTSDHQLEFQPSARSMEVRYEIVIMGTLNPRCSTVYCNATINYHIQMKLVLFRTAVI